VLKGVTTYINKDKIWKIFQDLKILFERRAGQNGKYNIRKYLKGYQVVVKVYGGIFVVVFFSIAAPIISFILYGKMNLAVKYWLPFRSQPHTFLMVWIWQIWSAKNCLVCLLASDSLLFCLITIIAMELDILRQDLLDLKLIPASDKKEKLSEHIDRHNKLLDISDELQDIYAFTFFVSFVISSLIMCFIAFVLSIATENVFEVYSLYVPSLLLVVGQIFLLCFHGQKLIDASVAVADGAWHSDWEDCDDIDVKKSLLMIMTRAQRAKKFTAMGFAKISLPTFTSVRTFYLFVTKN
jgi:7tm Odorant receptor